MTTLTLMLKLLYFNVLQYVHSRVPKRLCQNRMFTGHKVFTYQSLPAIVFDTTFHLEILVGQSNCIREPSGCALSGMVVEANA